MTDPRYEVDRDKEPDERHSRRTPKEQAFEELNRLRELLRPKR